MFFYNLLNTCNNMQFNCMKLIKVYIYKPLSLGELYLIIQTCDIVWLCYSLFQENCFLNATFSVLLDFHSNNLQITIKLWLQISQASWNLWELFQIMGWTNCIVSGTKVIKRLRRRKYGSGIFEKTIGLVLYQSIVIYRLCLVHCTLINKATGTT